MYQHSSTGEGLFGFELRYGWPRSHRSVLRFSRRRREIATSASNQRRSTLQMPISDEPSRCYLQQCATAAVCFGSFSPPNWPETWRQRTMVAPERDFKSLSYDGIIPLAYRNGHCSWTVFPSITTHEMSSYIHCSLEYLVRWTMSSAGARGLRVFAAYETGLNWNIFAASPLTVHYPYHGYVCVPPLLTAVVYIGTKMQLSPPPPGDLQVRLKN